MRRIALLTVAVALTAGLAPTAEAATSPRDRQRIARLEQQVRNLTNLVVGLQSQLAATNAQVAQVNRFAIESRNGDICGHAIATDMIYSSYYSIDLLYLYLTGSRVYGPIAGINDQGTCAAIGVRREAWSPRNAYAVAPVAFWAMKR